MLDGLRGVLAKVHCSRGIITSDLQGVFSTVPCTQWALSECTVVTMVLQSFEGK